MATTHNYKCNTYKGLIGTSMRELHQALAFSSAKLERYDHIDSFNCNFLTDIVYPLAEYVLSLQGYAVVSYMDFSIRSITTVGNRSVPLCFNNTIHLWHSRLLVTNSHKMKHMHAEPIRLHFLTLAKYTHTKYLGPWINNAYLGCYLTHVQVRSIYCSLTVISTFTMSSFEQ